MRRKWIARQKRPVVTVTTGSHSKTIVFGVLSSDGKQQFRQYDRFDSQTFIRYLEQVRKKFKKFVIFVDRAKQHISKVVQEYLHRNENGIKIEYFPVGSPEFNAGYRESMILSNYYPNFQSLRNMNSRCYRTKRFNLDIKKYLLRSMN